MHAQDDGLPETPANAATAHLVVLLCKLVEEEVRQVLDAGVGVLKAQSHSCNVPLHLHHVVHDQVGQHHQAVLTHPCSHIAASTKTIMMVSANHVEK